MQAIDIGPWHVENEPHNVWDCNGQLVCRVTHDIQDDNDPARSIATLIAASPEMISVCRVLKAWFRWQFHKGTLGPNAEYERLCEIIAKVDGATP